VLHYKSTMHILRHELAYGEFSAWGPSPSLVLVITRPVSCLLVISGTPSLQVIYSSQCTLAQGAKRMPVGLLDAARTCYTTASIGNMHSNLCVCGMWFMGRGS
jgi:hypothetical protein